VIERKFIILLPNTIIEEEGERRGEELDHLKKI
jgi:hypothetical protein